MNNNKLTNHIRTLLSISLLPMMLTMLVGCSSGGDSTPPPPTINIANTSVLEGNGSGTSSLIFTVTASAAVGSNATVNYTTSNGTATTADQDYVTQSGTISFTPGSTTASITILVNGDTLLEADETLIVTLSSPVNLTLGTASATGTIINDDDATFNGYFSGSATVNTDVADVDITDLIGLAYDNRLMLFSRTGASNVMYDITGITQDIGSNYTGSVVVYSGTGIAGNQTTASTTADLSISGFTISGTLKGTGLGAGTFSIEFTPSNNVGATLARIEGSNTNQDIWEGFFYGVDVDTGIFSSSATGYYSGGDDRIQVCAFGSVNSGLGARYIAIPDSQLNVFQMSHDVYYQGTGTCNTTYASTGHTGLASVITTTNTDDTLIYAFSNGIYALFAVMSH